VTRTVKIGLDLPSQILVTGREQAKKIVAAAPSGAASTNDRLVYFAAFDGTNNNLTTTGVAKNTNVAQLWTQFASGIGTTNPNRAGNYFPGPGTPGTLTRSAWHSPDVTQQVIRTAADAYLDFATKASNWLTNNPGGSVTTVLTAFSRGAAAAAIFSQMLFEKGLIDPNSDVQEELIPPGQVTVSAGVIFDAVATGVNGNLAFPPNVANIVNIRAQDEYRDFFKAVDYSAQSCVTTVAMLGNHCDIGGGYDNGIAALTLQAATTFLKNSGLPVASVSRSRRFAGVKSIAIHSEDVDDRDQPLWGVYPPGPEFLSSVVQDPSPRYADPDIEVTAATEVTSDASAVQTFVLYDGRTITRTKPAGASPDA